MKLKSRNLADPVCVFGNGREFSGGHDRYRSLRQAGPYDSTNLLNKPKILFVFPQEYRDKANQIYLQLRSGNNLFPGMSALFKIELAKEAVVRAPEFTLDGLSRSETCEKYRQAIQKALSKDNEINFAIVVCAKTPHDEVPSPYYTAKASLAAHGVPSQVITTDLIDNPNQFSWSVANIGLQIFVKLGGNPWMVRPSAGGGDIIFGVGRSDRAESDGTITRYVGYTTAYNAGGVFKSIEVFHPHTSFESYLAGFKEALVNAVKKVVPEGEDRARLVLHLPKKFSRKEKEQLDLALQELGSRIVGYVVLRINDQHPFQLFDMSHTSFAPISGLDVELDERNHLLLLEGRPKAGNMRRSPPSPLWVTLQSSSSLDSNFEALIQQIYELSVANWRGFNARAKPITVHYSEVIARILSSPEGNEIIEAISANESMRRVPWFV